jgi:thiosulfate/3-mercaptopyruvate sulfurtransferase
VDEKGLPYYQTDASQMTFKIGRNSRKSEDRPWDYVLVRHVPVAPDTFAFYGNGLLPAFDNVPTWKYATPHNIQRVTAQNESCDSCHGNAGLFLTAADVAPEELKANASVIVEEIPPTSWGPYPLIEGRTQAPERPAWLREVILTLVIGVVLVVSALGFRRFKPVQ